MKSNLLVSVLRGEIEEKRFFGWILLTDAKSNILKTLPEKNYTCYMRSCEKPLQLLVALNSGAIEKYNIESKDIALGFSSHSGSYEHITQLRSLLDRVDLKESDLLCGIHSPIDINEKNRLLKMGLEPSLLHNNCSGKHIFALISCILNGWNTKDYINIDHPLQQEIIKLVNKYCMPDKIYIAYDGCGMPVHAMDLHYMGTAFANIFSSESKYEKIIADSVTSNPIYAGGNSRIDTSIMQASQGKLIAKVGAEGLIIVSKRNSHLALVVKTSDGNNNIRDMVVVEALKQIDWLDNSELSSGFLDPFINLNIYNLSNKKVGRYDFKFNLQ